MKQARRAKTGLPAAWPQVAPWGWGLAFLTVFVAQAWANPQGMRVTRGNVSASRNGSLLSITASRNAVIDWQSFNIGIGETTLFNQPGRFSVVWNRISDQNPSQIWGNLRANGTVVLMNQSGFYFGPNSSVTVGGFIAASAAVMPPSSVGGGLWAYEGPRPTANIINYGQIRANAGGSVLLIAEGIENHGLISAPDGTLGLYAGKQVMISERISIKSAMTFADEPTSHIDVRGGGMGGNGGSVELCALTMDGVQSQLDGTARPGWTGGGLLLDPLSITLSANSGRTGASGTVLANDPPTASTLVLNVSRGFRGFSTILLQPNSPGGPAV